MRKTFSAPAFLHFHDQWHLSPGLDTGGYVFFSGVTGSRPDGTVAGDPEEQFRDVFLFLGETLKAGDLGGKTSLK